MTLPTTCMDCGGKLSVGLIVDRSLGMEVVSTWQKGEPQRKWWLAEESSNRMPRGSRSQPCAAKTADCLETMPWRLDVRYPWFADLRLG